MSKGQVIDELGDPDSTKASQGVEVLEYRMSPDSWTVAPYWIYVRDGKVVQYGRAGDFDSTRMPAQQLILRTQ